MAEGTAPISIDAQIGSVERELRQRERVYARLVHKRQMKPEAAAYETAAMTAVLETLKGVKAAQEGAAGALETLRKLQEGGR